MRQHRHQIGRALIAVGVLIGTALGPVAGATAATNRAAAQTGGHAHMMRRLTGSASGVNTLTTPFLQPYGGTVMQHVKIVEVVWDGGTYADEVTGSTPPDFPSFFGNVTSSSYFDWLSEYSAFGKTIGRGTFVGRYTITPDPANDGGTIDDATNIQPELLAQIDAHNLPAPDADTLYFLFFPSGKTITMGGSDNINDFCAYHGTMTHSGATNIRYAVLPDSAAAAPGCGNSQGFGNMTSVASHEMIEAVTDPDVGLANSLGPPLSWYDATYGEIGDICNGEHGTVAGADTNVYTVQTEWSNQALQCVTSGSPRVISIGSASMLEGDAGYRTMRFPVTLSAPSTIGMSVHYQVYSGTAHSAAKYSAGVDVVNSSGTVSFVVAGGGVTPVLKYILVPVYGDKTIEATEAFTVRLSSPSIGYALGRSIAYGTIISDDPHSVPTVGDGDMSVVVGAAGNRQISFPVTMSRALTTPVSMHFAVTGVTATAGVDFSGTLSGTVTIPAGQLAAWVTLTVIPKPNAVTAKTLRVTLSALHGTAVLVRTIGTGTLLAA